MHLKPAEYVIHVFGSITKAAKAIGLHKTSVHKWKRSKEKRGCDGLIPTAAQQKILSIATEMGLDITPNDLILGREVDEKTA